MKKQLEMNLLNSEEIKGLKGGAGGTATCSKAGDTIWCNVTSDYKLCGSTEVTCPSSVAIDCEGGKFSIHCPTGVTITY